MIEVASVVGPRPSFVKLAPIAKILDHTIIHTGQHYHYEMSQIFFEELEIPEPDYFLSVGSGSDGEQLSKIIKRVYEVVTLLSAKIVLVYGDSNTAVGAALAANKAGASVGHVESGVRNNDRSFPEEINRMMAEACSEYLFCPTETAYHNVRSTGRAYLTGDVMCDVMKSVKKFRKKLPQKYGISNSYLLLTTHRRRNVDNFDVLKKILGALGETGYDVIYPVHPRARKTLLNEIIPENVVTVKPQGYISFLSLLRSAERVFTDSGGVQKEAYLLGVPCSTLLNSTPWVETLVNNWNRLVGADPERILDSLNYVPSGDRPDLFGDGHAAENIVKVIKDMDDKHDKA